MAITMITSWETDDGRLFKSRDDAELHQEAIELAEMLPPEMPFRIFWDQMPFNKDAIEHALKVGSADWENFPWLFGVGIQYLLTTDEGRDTLERILLLYEKTEGELP